MHTDLLAPSLPLELILRATRGALVRRGAQAVFAGAAIDGRGVPKGGLFFAIRGERFDGHDFAAQAVEHGATGLIVERGRGAALARTLRVAVIEVDDTVAALGDLARAHVAALREKSRPGGPLRVVGVAGSNGKTTTKELIASVLGAAVGDAAVHKTSGNLNNHLGVPLTLLGLHEGHRYAVIEMGMSALGELAYLAALARPDIGVVVSIGPEHLEHLHTLENVARAEGEIFAALAPSAVAVYPEGDALIAPYAEASPAHRRVRFGAAPGCAVRLLAAEATVHGTRVALRLPDGRALETRLAVVGVHNGQNAACAAAVGHALGLDPETISRGLSAARPARHRSTLVEIAGRHVIDDCYNAAPPSVAAALETLVALARAHARNDARGTIAVLGDMLELGPDELSLHREAGAHAATLGVGRLLLFGERSRETAAGAIAAGLPAERVAHYTDTGALTADLARLSVPGEVLLVKGSRGMRLERVLDGLGPAVAALTHLEDAAHPSHPERG